MHFRLRHYPFRNEEQFYKRLYKDRANLERDGANWHYNAMIRNLESIKTIQSNMFHFDDKISELSQIEKFDWSIVYPNQGSSHPAFKYGTYYFDTGKGLSEEETEHFQHNNKEVNHFKGKTALPQNTKAIRFDPVEGCGCLLQNLVIKSDTGKVLDYKILNGFKSENNGIVFTTKDPQIFVEIKKGIKKIEIQCDIWFFI